MLESSRENLRSTFGDAIRIDNDEIVWHRDTNPETDDQRKQDTATTLRERAREHFLQARSELERLRIADDGTEVAFPGEEGALVAPLYLAQASAVAVGSCFMTPWPRRNITDKNEVDVREKAAKDYYFLYWLTLDQIVSGKADGIEKYWKAERERRFPHLDGNPFDDTHDAER